MKQDTISWYIVVLREKIWHLYHYLLLNRWICMQSLRVKYWVEIEIHLAYFIPMSSLLILHWSLYCIFVVKCFTESYPSCVEATQKVWNSLLKKTSSNNYAYAELIKSNTKYSGQEKFWNFYCNMFMHRIGPSKILRLKNILQLSV